MNTREIIQKYELLADEVATLQEQIAELSIEKKRYEVQMQEIEEAIKADMIGAQMKNAVVAGWKINISKSTSTVIEAADELPEEFWRIERAPDLMKVKEALKMGLAVGGARLVIRQNINMKKRQE